MIAVGYPVCIRADLDGIGNQSSGFLSGHSCDAFKCQSDLFKKKKEEEEKCQRQAALTVQRSLLQLNLRM